MREEGLEKQNGILEGVIWKQLLIFFFPILVGTFFQQAGPFLLGIFTGDEAVVAIGMTMMRRIAPAFVMFVFIEIFSGSLRAQGYTFVTTVISILCVCVYRIIWVNMIPPGRGLTWIISCYPISWVVCAFLVSVYYFYKQKRIIGRVEAKG